MHTYENTHAGYFIDENGKRHTSIHPNGRNVKSTSKPYKWGGKLAKASKNLDRRRRAYNGYGKVPGSMKWN